MYFYKIQYQQHNITKQDNKTANDSIGYVGGWRKIWHRDP